jgi:hypothetical protein
LFVCFFNTLWLNSTSLLDPVTISQQFHAGVVVVVVVVGCNKSMEWQSLYLREFNDH